MTWSISRRELLRTAGRAFATVGVSGLGGLLAACADDETTTTTVASNAEPSTTLSQSTTTVVTGPELGEEIRCGYVLPLTGAMAAFGIACAWEIDWFNKNVWKDGMVLGDGKMHKITVLAEDMQSDSRRAAQMAGDLIANAGVDLIGASAGSSSVLAVRDTAEALGCPCITFGCSGDAWNAGQPEGGFQWCWHTWFLLKDVTANFLSVWDQIETNKKIGTLFPDNADGLAFHAALPPAWEASGYTTVDGGRLQDAMEDYSSVISLFESEGVEIIVGAMSPADFANFWIQSLQQDLRVKVSTQAKALLLPDGVETLGDSGVGQSVETWFHPGFPFTSDVTGLNAQQVAGQFSSANDRQWTQPVCFFGQFEVWTDILQRCTDPTDKHAIVAATNQTDLMTIGGRVNWTQSPEPYSGWRNFCRKPITGGQWVKSSGPYEYDLEIVASATDPDIPTTASPMEIPYE